MPKYPKIPLNDFYFIRPAAKTQIGLMKHFGKLFSPIILKKVVTRRI